MKNQSNYVKTFLAHFSEYKMYIEAAGIAAIPSAKLSAEDILDIHYAYTSGDEKRKGQMLLVWIEGANRFEGSWETKADNGNVYKGTMYFIFAKDGTANGWYDYGGNAYEIKIFDPKEKR